MRKILSLFGMLSAAVLWGQSGLTGTEHYIYSKTCLNGDCTKASENVQYFDSFGRPFQSVGIKASPSGKDIVQHIPYDSHGRTADSWYPVPMSSMGGAVQDSSAVKANALSVYGDSRPFSHSVLENSPLSRVLSSVAPGQDWQNHPVTMGYNTNTAGEVKRYSVSTTWTQGRTQAVLSQLGDYPAGTLIRKMVTDEDQNTSVQFVNKEGQLVLSRKGAGTATVTDTYYVYDEYGHLTYVIPPLAAVGAVSETVLNDLCYQYRYDGWHRLVEKKLPGKGWEYMVYDKADRLVLTQDALQEQKSQWLLTKYDSYGRVAYTGIILGGGRSAMQSEAGPTLIVEKRNSAGFTQDGMHVQYTNDYFYALQKILSINYYDTYPQYSFNPAFPTAIQGETVLTDNFASDAGNTKGFPVMSLVKNIEDDNWTKSYSYFDARGRVIGSYSINHLGGYTRTESKLDFAGLPQKTLARHKRLETDPERLITQTYEYDPQGRLLVHKHQIDNNPEEILTQNTYNELSQLTSKKVGGTNVSQPLQTIDYQYNVRGWLTKINDPANLNGKLFGYEIRYQNPVYTNKAAGRYNGNITEADWKNASENILKRYSYAYDGQNRLNTAFYAEPDATNPHNGNYDEAMTYDLNGNIRTLKRKAFPVLGTTATLIDDLDYQYTGNRLNQVIESSMNDLGYEGGNNLISYDANGNMADMKDKGIHSIYYNLLDLPVNLSITQVSGKTLRNGIIEYVYRADGTKLRKNYTLYGDRATGDAVRITDYLDGFQYSYYNPRSTCPTCRTESAFEEQAYKNIGDVFPGTETPEWKLDFVATAEGFYSFTENRYIYQYKDQLGNARVSFAQNSAGALEITDTNNYYPLGLNHTGGNGINSSKIGSYNSYKYNGKELQETGMFDYGARFYMPDLGRWGVVDPLAEQMRRHSPYNYAFNNPVNYIDPDGRQPYNPRDFYGEHSVFSGNFDPNSTLQYGTGSFGYTNYSTAFKFAEGDQAGGSGEIGDLDREDAGDKTYYGEDAYNALQNLLNPQANFSQFDFSQYGAEECCPDKASLNDRIGDKVLPAKETSLGKIWAKLEPRSWTDSNGRSYNVGADGKITGIRPLMGDAPFGAGNLKSLGTARTSFQNAVKNQKLSNIVNELYKRNARVGNGSSMDAFRYEQLTGLTIRGRSHGQKILDYRKALQKLWHNRQDLSNSEKQVVKELLKDIQNALSGN